MKRTILGFLLCATAIAASAADKNDSWESLPPGPRLREPAPREDFYGRLNGKRVMLDALVWYDQTGISGRVVLPSGTSVYIKDPYVARPGDKFPKIEPRLPVGRLVRLVGVLTIDHYEPPRPFPKDGQGYSWALSYLALKLESFTVVEKATLEEPELSHELARDANWKKIAALRVPIKEVEVIGGNELEIGGIRCRLFGIQIPSSTAEAAKQFLERYMKSYGAFFSIYNDTAPVNDKDGVPLIWLQGSGEGGWAQETLVQAGLATVNYSGFEDYRFTAPGKAGDYQFDWKGCLKRAEVDFQTGKKPHFLYRWPQPK